MKLFEGGNVFNNTNAVARDDVASVVDIVRRNLPGELQKQLIPDIGSAGFKVESGDIDVFIDQAATVKNFGVEDEKQAKQALAQYFSAKGYAVKVMGRNVHVDVPYKSADGKTLYAQVDVMVIPNAKGVADWHQHGPRGMYDDPAFKASHLYILLNSINSMYKNSLVFSSIIYSEIWEEINLPNFYILHDGLNQNYLLFDKIYGRLLPFFFHDICPCSESNMIIGRHHGKLNKFDFCKLVYKCKSFGNSVDPFLEISNSVLV